MYTCAASLDAVFRLDIVESAGTMITAEPAPQEGSGNTISKSCYASGYYKL